MKLETFHNNFLKCKLHQPNHDYVEKSIEIIKQKDL